MEDDCPRTPSREESEEAREMGSVAAGSLSEEMDTSKFSMRLHRWTQGARKCC